MQSASNDVIDLTHQLGGTETLMAGSSTARSAAAAAGETNATMGEGAAGTVLEAANEQEGGQAGTEPEGGASEERPLPRHDLQERVGTASDAISLSSDGVRSEFPPVSGLTSSGAEGRGERGELHASEAEHALGGAITALGRTCDQPAPSGTEFNFRNQVVVVAFAGAVPVQTTCVDEVPTAVKDTTRHLEHTSDICCVSYEVHTRYDVQ